MIEIAAVLFSLLSVYLGAKNNILTWPIGIIGIIFYFILFYNNSVMGNAYLQFLFILQSIFGWSKWGKERKILNLTNKQSNLTISLCIILSFTVIYTLYLSGCKNVMLDGITTSISIIALILMSYKKVNCWYYWIIVDIIFVIFFIKINLYLSAATYFIFLILAIYGLKEWKKISKMV